MKNTTALTRTKTSAKCEWREDQAKRDHRAQIIYEARRQDRFADGTCEQRDRRADRR